MKKNIIINACSDLGVNVDGSRNAPIILSKYFNKIETITINANHINKSNDKLDLKKNLKELNKFNENLYNTIISNNNFNITIGGDHSISIATALGSLKKYKSLGIIWIDSHGDYNTFETTKTGNIHGLPLATINGQNNNLLTKFHDGHFINPKNTVIIGARDIDPLEYVNLSNAGVKIFTTEDIKNSSIDEIIKEAINIASENTNGIHVSCDIDIIDPNIAKGINIPAKNGINIKDYFTIYDSLLKYKDKIKSFDLVEYNPDKDINNETLDIAVETLKKIITNM